MAGFDPLSDVAVDELDAFEELAGERARQGFAAAENLQAEVCVPASVDQSTPGPWRRLHDGGAATLEEREQGIGVVDFLGCGEDEARAGEERKEALESGRTSSRRSRGWRGSRGT